MAVCVQWPYMYWLHTLRAKCICTLHNPPLRTQLLHTQKQTDYRPTDRPTDRPQMDTSTTRFLCRTATAIDLQRGTFENGAWVGVISLITDRTHTFTHTALRVLTHHSCHGTRVLLLLHCYSPKMMLRTYH
jgi:hypothetical protein